MIADSMKLMEGEDSVSGLKHAYSEHFRAGGKDLRMER